jgi:hypothetical protein
VRCGLDSCGLQRVAHDLARARSARAVLQVWASAVRLESKRGSLATWILTYVHSACHKASRNQTDSVSAQGKIHIILTWPQARRRRAIAHAWGLVSAVRTSVSSHSFSHPHALKSALYPATALSLISSGRATRASTCVRHVGYPRVLLSVTHTRPRRPPSTLARVLPLVMSEERRAPPAQFPGGTLHLEPDLVKIVQFTVRRGHEPCRVG